MSIVHRIIQAHDGKITVTSEPGRGTVLTIRLHNTPGTLQTQVQQ